MTQAVAVPYSLGPVCAFGAISCFAINDIVMKGLSTSYALHEIILFRAIFGLAIMLGIIVPLTSGYRALRTPRWPMHLARGGCIVFANTFFFMGLAAMPLADCVALFFISPLLITGFSVVFLGETVGPRRWTAILVGLVGVIIVLRPGTTAFQPAALFPIAAAFGYAGLHTLTRKIGNTESAATMAFYLQAMFFSVSLAMGLTVGYGQFDTFDNVSLSFLFRAWVWPEASSIFAFAWLGLATSVGGWLISQAYRVSAPAHVAPVEYVAIPFSVLGGILFFGEYPDGVALAGIALILASGLYMVWREGRGARI
jgi:drug/metabolite transporter (DMT)-like permease